jgi:hypothetical protein
MSPRKGFVIGVCWAEIDAVVRRTAVKSCVRMEGSMTSDDSGSKLRERE